MTENAVVETEKTANKRPARQRKEGQNTKRPARRGVDVTEFRTWLDSLETGVKPTIHVNGASYTTAIAVVDFGNPLKSFKLTPEQVQELMNRLRQLGKDVVGNNAYVRVSSDNSNGIYWVALG